MYNINATEHNLAYNLLVFKKLVTVNTDVLNLVFKFILSNKHSKISYVILCSLIVFVSLDSFL